jgi:hypothetical protein
MKYWDTSALLRAWKEGWSPASGMTRSHTLAEWFHIQVGRGMVFTNPDGTQEKRALIWPVAAEELRRLVKHLTFVDLNASQVLDALDTLARVPGLKASAAHDFLHIRAGELNNAQALVTLNLAEWAQLTALKCELPVKP